MRYILLFSFLSLQSLFSSEFVALLLRANDDSLFHFTYNNRAFSCEPAAITTLAKLYRKPNLSKECKSALVHFVKKYPYADKQYAYKLHDEQKYMIQAYKGACFVMLNAGISFSEHLLERGFAVLSKKPDPRFVDTPIYQKLSQAQQRAIYHEKGVWGEKLLSNCFTQ